MPEVSKPTPRENGVFPIAQSANAITILVSDSTDLETIEKIRFILNRNIIPMAGSADAIRDATNQCYGHNEGESAEWVGTTNDRGKRAAIFRSIFILSATIF
jgi:hypothetical protein